MGGMFSLDNGTGTRFLTRSRLFTDRENAWPENRPALLGEQTSLEQDTH